MPFSLAGIEGKVDSAIQLRAVDPVIRRNCYANRRADNRAATVDRVGLRNDLNDPRGKISQLAAIINIRQYDLEFITAQTSDFAFAFDERGEPLANTLGAIGHQQGGPSYH